MKFNIKVDPDLSNYDKVITFSGEFTQSEVMELKLSGLERRMIEMVHETPADTLLALEMVYRRYEKAVEAGHKQFIKDING